MVEQDNLTPDKAAFHPPDWSDLPCEANKDAILEALKDSKSVASLSIGKKQVTVFGRDKDQADHVLDNLSISRSHAAIIHDASGGVYLVDLMSRHGTFISKVKLPPHEPTLIRDGDVIQFGQSSRNYFLRNVDVEGKCAKEKKSWKFKTPKLPGKISIGVRLPKKSKPDNARKLRTPEAIKLIHSVCYGASIPHETLTSFCKQVESMNDEQASEVIAALFDKVQVKFELKAAQIHRNALHAVIELLNAAIGAVHVEEHLPIITQISQAKNASDRRTAARKILQLLAEVKVDPEAVRMQSSIMEEEEDEEEIDTEESKHSTQTVGEEEEVSSSDAYIPPVILPASKKPTAQAPPAPSENHTEEPPQDAYVPPFVPPPSSKPDLQTPPPPAQEDVYHPPREETPNLQMPSTDDSKRNYVDSAPISTSSHTSYSDDVYEDRYVEEDRFDRRGHHEHHTKATQDDAGVSGFQFMQQATISSPSERRAPASGFDFMGGAPASVCAQEENIVVSMPSGFLLPNPTIDELAFERHWEEARESEEWTLELSHVPGDNELEQILHEQQIECLAGGRVSGIQKYFFFAQQASNGTLFMVELDITVAIRNGACTFKWFVTDLLYDDGHLVFIEHFKNILLSRYSSPQAAALTSTDGQALHQANHFELKAHPVLDPSIFEKTWVEATILGECNGTLHNYSSSSEFEDVMNEEKFLCFASGSVEGIEKFFFYAEVVDPSSLIIIELSLDPASEIYQSLVKGTNYRLASHPLGPEIVVKVQHLFDAYL